MSRPEYKKRWYNEPIYEGVREALLKKGGLLSEEALSSIDIILDALEWLQLIVFYYDGSDRIVAPFVVGLSSDGNPLLRGFQLEGFSRSGKGRGWRVFQVRKMERLENHQEHFDPYEFDFDNTYPWIYSVIKTL